MITLTFHRTEKGNLTGFTLSGHAGYAAAGEPDILCAAVTALATGTIGSLQDLLQVPLRYTAEEGDIRCRYEAEALDPRQREDADLLLRALRLSCTQIALTYGTRYLHISD